MSESTVSLIVHTYLRVLCIDQHIYIWMYVSMYVHMYACKIDFRRRCGSMYYTIYTCVCAHYVYYQYVLIVYMYSVYIICIYIYLDTTHACSCA